MKTAMKRLFSLLLALTLIGAMFPTVYAAGAEENTPEAVTRDAYTAADAVFDSIDAMESAPAKKRVPYFIMISSFPVPL